MGHRNAGIDFDMSLLAVPGDSVSIVEGNAPTPDELRQIVRCMDYTTLGGDDTPSSVADFCLRAKQLVGGETVAAVCLFPVFVRQALSAVQGTSIQVATVAAAFPHGLSMLENRVTEVQTARELGAHDIDIVIHRSKAIDGAWHDLYREIRAFRTAAGDCHLKVILESGELKTPDTIYRAAMTSMMGGADFVKTSTGKSAINATPEAAATMLRAIQAFRERTGHLVGFKAAGGIRTAEQATVYLRTAASAMGESFITPETFRIGASALRDSVEQAIG